MDRGAEARTQCLRRLMDEHKLTARQVGKMLNREPHTVRCWRSAWDARAIPEHALELLEVKLAGVACES